MKNFLLIFGSIAVIFLLSLVVYNRSNPAVLGDESIEQRTLTIAPGLIAERNTLGEITGLDVVSTTASVQLEDYQKALESEFIEKGTALALNRGNVRHNNETITNNLISFANADFSELFDFPLAEGRFYSDDESKNVAVVGQKLANELRDKGVENVIGERVSTRDIDFEIIGIFDDIDTGSEAADSDWNKLLLIPFHQSFPLIDQDKHLIEEVRLAVTSTSVLEQARADVTKLLVESRGQEDFSILTPDDLRVLGL